MRIFKHFLIGQISVVFRIGAVGPSQAEVGCGAIIADPVRFKNNLECETSLALIVQGASGALRMLVGNDSQYLNSPLR